MKKNKKLSYFSQVKEYYKSGDKISLFIYVFLRAMVILCMVIQFIHKNYNNVFLCLLTLVLFTLPYIIDRKLKIDIPSFLEIVILLFIYSAEILGEIQNFYGIFKHWDTLLHTINGFLCAAIGFSLIDILNRSENFHMQMAPIFVSLVSFCFSMTVGVIWEFYEYASDIYFKTDMQKDRIVTSISSVKFHDEGKNIPVDIEDITETIIISNNENMVVDTGYLDIGLHDTMKDLIVNLVGAVTFSIVGLFYIKDRDGYKFAEMFIPTIKND